MSVLSDSLNRAVDSLLSQELDQHLSKINRGIEKESLRVTPDGTLALTPHPHALGSSLTHGSITTDYSESLLEFVTGIHTNISELLQELHDIHHFTYQHIGNEKLWVNSMPCIVESEEKIPIARYGPSNIARMKEIYREGLHHRYGSLMQTIAGIHYNFSLPEEFWNALVKQDDSKTVRDYKSTRYFGLIRNYHRLSWATVYLFGASPAVCQTFLNDREHFLTPLHRHTFYGPNATSLRLSNLGYSNEAQNDICINYNNVGSFVRSLRHAIQTSYPPYERIGIKTNGDYRQLNSNLLQIENEFYASIRPKRVARSGQSPSRALCLGGVEYVEIRNIDLNPFVPIGIDAECIRFYDLLLLACLLLDSPEMDDAEFQMSCRNQQEMVMNGRNPDARIMLADGERNSHDQMHELLDALSPLAELLDALDDSINYRLSLQAQRLRIDDSDLTPSGQIAEKVINNEESFFEFAMNLAEESEHYFKNTQLDEETSRKFKQMSENSHQAQKDIESSDSMSFDDFLIDYFNRQNAPMPTCGCGNSQ